MDEDSKYKPICCPVSVSHFREGIASRRQIHRVQRYARFGISGGIRHSGMNKFRGNKLICRSGIGRVMSRYVVDGRGAEGSTRKIFTPCYLTIQFDIFAPDRKGLSFLKWPLGFSGSNPFRSLELKWKVPRCQVPTVVRRYHTMLPLPGLRLRWRRRPMSCAS